MGTVDVDVSVYGITSFPLVLPLTTTIAEVKERVSSKTTIPVADIRMELVNKNASNDFIKDVKTTLGELEMRDGKIWLGLRTPTIEGLGIANHLKSVGFPKTDAPKRDPEIGLTITVRDFRASDERVFDKAFTIKANSEKSPLSMYVEEICENQRFNIIRRIADDDEWKAMWFHKDSAKPLNHPFNSLKSQGVKAGDEIEVHLVKADDERFRLFHEEARENAKKTIDKMNEEKGLSPADVAVSLADTPASSAQPPAPVVPAVQGEMTLADLEALIAEREDNLKQLKKDLSTKKKEEKCKDITVHLRQPSGNTFPVVTQAIKTVRQFKEQDVARLMERNWDDIMLLMGHEQMRAQKQLHSYGIRDGSTIDILVRLRGGEDNTMVDAKVFNIVLPLPKLDEEALGEDDDDDEDAYLEHFKTLGVLDYILYGCEIDKDDVLTDAMQLYQSSFGDLLDNPKTVMVREFRGRNLFGIEIDKNDAILVKTVKEEIANRLRFLAKTNGSTISFTEDDFMLNGLGDNDYLSPSTSAVELLLRLRGGGVKNTGLKQKRDNRLNLMKLKAQGSVSEALGNQASVDAKLIAKCEKEMKKLMEKASNDYLTTMVGEMDKDAVVSFYNITDGGKLKLQDDAVCKIAPVFIPIIDELEETIEKANMMKKSFIQMFEYLYALNFLQDTNRYNHTLYSLIEDRVKGLKREEDVEAEIAKRMQNLSVSRGA